MPRIALAQRQGPPLPGLRSLPKTAPDKDFPPEKARRYDAELLAIWTDDRLGDCPEARPWLAAVKAHHREEQWNRLREAVARGDLVQIVEAFVPLKRYPVPRDLAAPVREAGKAFNAMAGLFNAVHRGDRGKFVELFNARIIRRHAARFAPFQARLRKWMRDDILPPEKMRLAKPTGRPTVTAEERNGRITWQICWNWPAPRFSEECVVVLCRNVPPPGRAEQRPRRGEISHQSGTLRARAAALCPFSAARHGRDASSSSGPSLISASPGCSAGPWSWRGCAHRGKVLAEGEDDSSALLHALYVRHVGARKAAGRTAQHVLGYSARASSLTDREKTLKTYRQVERFLNYRLPADTPAQERMKLEAFSPAPPGGCSTFPPRRRCRRSPGRSATARKTRPPRLAMVPISHVLVGDGDSPWNVLTCLQLWDAAWAIEDRPGDIDLAPLADLDSLAGSSIINDEVLLSFLTAECGGALHDPGGVVPNRWRPRAAGEAPAAPGGRVSGLPGNPSPVAA